MSCQNRLLHGMCALEQLSAEQQRAPWFADGSAKMNGQHPVWKAAALRPVVGKTLIE